MVSDKDLQEAVTRHIEAGKFLRGFAERIRAREREAERQRQLALASALRKRFGMEEVSK